jgi:multiple sugar transport system permease protein
MIKKERKNLYTALIFISPWIIGFGIFILYPFIMSLYYSFCHYNIFESPTWIGLNNYINLFKDRVFWISLYNTFYYAAISIPIGVLLSLGLALLLNSRVKGQTFFRVVFYIPSLVPMVAMSILWLWIFNGEHGVLNHVLTSIGLQRPPNWLADARYAKLAIIIMGLWPIGQAVIIYLAALQDVPRSLIEAAEIDGALWYHKIRHIIIPIISPVILFNVLMAIIGSFQIFAAPYIMTGGGPGKSTTFYTMYLYQKAFEDFRMGYASSMAWILFVIILCLTIFAIRVSKKKVYYME